MAPAFTWHRLHFPRVSSRKMSCPRRGTVPLSGSGRTRSDCRPNDSWNASKASSSASVGSRKSTPGTRCNVLVKCCITAPVANDRSVRSAGAPSPDHPVCGPEKLATEVDNDKTCGTPRRTPGFWNPSTFSRIRPSSRKSRGFSRAARPGSRSAMNKGSLRLSVAMNAGSRVKLFSTGWQVPQVLPLPLKVSLKNRSSPRAMRRARAEPASAPGTAAARPPPPTRPSDNGCAKATAREPTSKASSRKGPARTAFKDGRATGSVPRKVIRGAASGAKRTVTLCMHHAEGDDQAAGATSVRRTTGTRARAPRLHQPSRGAKCPGTWRVRGIIRTPRRRTRPALRGIRHPIGHAGRHQLAGKTSQHRHRRPRRPRQDHARRPPAAAVRDARRARGAHRAHHGLERAGARARDHHPRQEYGALLAGLSDQHRRYPGTCRFRRRGGADPVDGGCRALARRCRGRPHATDALRDREGLRARSQGHRGREQDRPARRARAVGRGPDLRPLRSPGGERGTTRLPGGVRLRPAGLCEPQRG